MPAVTQISAAQIAATRHLIGLSQAELADALGVNRHAVKDWESGRFAARPGVIADLAALRAEHDAETGWPPIERATPAPSTPSPALPEALVDSAHSKSKSKNLSS